MKFITVRDFRGRPAQIWKELRKQDEMVVTSNGKPVALLTPLSEGTMERTLRTVRRARAIAALTALQERSIATGKDALTLTEINSSISEVRRRGKR